MAGQRDQCDQKPEMVTVVTLTVHCNPYAQASGGLNTSDADRVEFCRLALDEFFAPTEDDACCDPPPNC
jgi:hypothetical protein